MAEETVTISKKEHDRLLLAALELQCLEALGVDNWEGYSEACNDAYEIMKLWENKDG